MANKDHRIASAILHAVSRDPGRSRHVDESQGAEAAFEDGLESTERFFARLAGAVDVSGKTVLDYGTGLGSSCFWLAENEARRAVGVDIQDVSYAQSMLEERYPQLVDRVEFRQLKDGYETGGERFDLVISKNTFEHVDEPEAYVAAMKAYLAPGGEIAVGFGPLWKSPWGGHINYMTRLPWAHLLFPEEAIMRERRRYRPGEEARRFEEIRGGLNRMTLGRFLSTMQSAGLEQRYLATNVATDARSPIRRALINGLDVAGRFGPLREYMTLNVYSVWRAPTRP